MGETLYSDPQVLKRRDPVNARAAAWLDRALGTDIPTYPLESPFAQAQRLVGAIYLAWRYWTNALSAAQPQLEKPAKARTGVASPGARRTDPEYVPVPSHPLADVIRKPNPADTLPRFLSKWVMQKFLHGSALVWGAPNRVGAPEHLYVLPRPLCQPVYAAGVNPDYPKGAWRVNPYYQGGFAGIIPSRVPVGAIIDAREIYEDRDPHPLSPWLPYSPLKGIDKQSDLLDMIDRSCWSVMQNGVNPSAILTLMGADDTTADAVQAKIAQRWAGPDNAGRVAVVNNPAPDGKSALQPLTPSARDMAYGEAWDRYTAFVLAAVGGLDPALVGLKDPNYSTRWAARQDWREMHLEPFLSSVSAVLGGAVKAWGLEKNGVRVNISLPPLSDPAMVGGIKDAAGDGSGLMNEVRAARGLPPVEGGDVPIQIYLSRLGAGPKAPKNPGADRPETIPGEGSPGDAPRPDTGAPAGMLAPRPEAKALVMPARKRVLRGKKCRKLLRGMVDGL